MDGQGVAKDESKAVQWWQAAAAHGLAQAQFNLGICVARGTLWSSA
jgi:TPR repeat protein